MNQNVQLKTATNNNNLLIANRILWLLIYFLSPIFPIIVTILSSPNPKYFSDPLTFISLITGVSGFVWLSYQFILSSRPKFIEKFFGLDKFYIFHGLMAVISILLVFIHQTILSLKYQGFDSAQMTLGSLAFYLYIAVSALALIFVSASILLKIKPILKIKNLLTKFNLFRHNNQVLLHNIVIVAYIVMFIHVLLAPTVIGQANITIVYALYFIIGAVFYLYHTFIKKIILDKNLFIVKNIIKESGNMWTLQLIPDHGDIFLYKPGQFGYIKIYGKKIKAEVHPFSISSSPTNKEYISFTIKELGDFTNTIGQVSLGDKVRVDAPYGVFSYSNYPKEKNTILIAGGVGITPNLSMLRYMVQADKSHNSILFWGIGNTKEIICSEELSTMEKEMESFNFVPVVFKDTSFQGEKGIIDREKIERLLKQYNMNIQESGFYLCGPAIMTNGVVKTLKNMGVKKEFIHFEKFSM